MCCCIIPLCYYYCTPDAGAYFKKMTSNARMKIKNLTDPDNSYSELRDRDLDGRQNDREKLKRKKRERDKDRERALANKDRERAFAAKDAKPLLSKKKDKKPRPTIQIPIRSDTSVDICITTEEDGESCSSDDSEDTCQYGYVSKEMDALHCASDSPTEMPPKPIPQDTCPFKPIGGSKKGNNDTKAFYQNEIDNRYRDGPGKMTQKANPAYSNKTVYKTPNSTPPENIEEHYPELKSYVESHLGNPSKSEYYDKLVKEWKYKRLMEASQRSDNLGPPPPPRSSKKKKKNRDNNFAF